MPIPRAAAERNATRTRRRYFPMTVTDRRTVSANTVRFTFGAPEFADFSPLGPDEFFALVIPQPGQQPPRSESAETGPSDRPDVRWYTVRAHRPQAAEIDVDVVLHGENGPASRWAGQARSGDRVGFREANAGYLPADPGHQLLVADETAVPALAAILETAPRGLDASVIIELPQSADLPEIATDCELTVLTRGDARPGELALAAATAVADEHDLAYAWACGERATATDIRRMLVRRGMSKDAIMFSGYWRLGSARG